MAKFSAKSFNKKGASIYKVTFVKRDGETTTRVFGPDPGGEEPIDSGDSMTLYSCTDTGFRTVRYDSIKSVEVVA